MSNTQLNRDRLKSELVTCLRLEPKTQYRGIINRIEHQIGRNLELQEAELLLEIIHGFIVSNLLMTALNAQNAGWPC